MMEGTRKFNLLRAIRIEAGSVLIKNFSPTWKHSDRLSQRLESRKCVSRYSILIMMMPLFHLLRPLVSLSSPALWFRRAKPAAPDTMKTEFITIKSARKFNGENGFTFETHAGKLMAHKIHFNRTLKMSLRALFAINFPVLYNKRTVSILLLCFGGPSPRRTSTAHTKPSATHKWAAPSPHSAEMCRIFTTLADLFMCENVWCWNVPVVTRDEGKKNWKHSIIKIYVLWCQTDIKISLPHATPRRGKRKLS